MLKFLKGVVDRSVSGIKDFPYNIDEPYSSAWGSWTHCRGTSKDDGSLVSIFYLSGNSSQDGHLLAGRNGVKRLRTVRHPNILSFIHSTEAEVNDGSMTKVTIYIVTEPVMPLSEKIKELNLEAAQRNEYYAWGLSQIAKAVSFLNNDCKLVHGNVCLISIVVTQTLDWKLHAFDVLSEFDGNLEAPNGSMLQYEWLVGSQYKSMELAKSDWALIRKSPPWAIDSWGLGCLIYELFSGIKLCKTEELRNTAAIPKSLLPDYQRLLSSTPSRRLNSSKLIENSEYFNNKLVETIQFMEVLNLKDSVEKDIFFRKLPNIVDQLPRQIVLKKLLPLLASALEFGSTASSSALTTLLKMGSWLSVDEFSIKVLPSIVKLFASSDRAVRVGLLQHVDQFSESLTPQLVDEQIFPYVATGFSDSSAFLRELTVKSMLVLAPKLSQRTLSGSLLKHLSKLQVDEEPAIRTNTTILLGNIASYLNEGMRKRVLINAFTTRALRDDFSPARAAGIMALCATSAYYDMSEIATRVLPNIVVLTIDPDHDVRLKAFQAIDQFLQIARQHHEKVRGIEVDVEQHEKFSIQAAAHHDNLDVTHHTGEHSTSISTPLDHTTPSSPTSMDGWREVENGILHDNFESDKEGWDAIEPLEELRPPELASIQATQKRLFAQPKQHAEHSFRANSSVVIKPSSSTFASAKSNDNDLWGLVATREAGCASKASSAKPKVPGEDGDIWGTIAALPSRTTSKPFKSAVAIDDDPWMAIAAAPPVTKVKPLSSGQGRGVKQTPTKLGAHRIGRTS